MAQRCFTDAERDVLDGVSWLWIGVKGGEVFTQLSRFPAAPEAWPVLESQLFPRQGGALLERGGPAGRFIEWSAAHPDVVSGESPSLVASDAVHTELERLVLDHERAELVDAYDLPLTVTWLRLWVDDGTLTWVEYGAEVGDAPAVPVQEALRSVMEVLWRD